MVIHFYSASKVADIDSADCHAKWMSALLVGLTEPRSGEDFSSE